MPSCCVSDCNNYYQKGFSMRPFPTDPARKALWMSKINRMEWESCKKWFICEVHFSEDMWEKPRVDRKRKLKQNAVPTLFANTQSQIDRRNNEESFPSTSTLNKAQVGSDTQQDANNVETFTTCHEMQHSMNSTPEQSISSPLRNIFEQSIENDVEITIQGIPQLSAIPCEETLNTNVTKKLEEAESNARQAIFKVEEANQKLKQANIVLCKMNKSKRLLQKHIKRLNDEKKKIEKENLQLKSLLKLNKIFNDDQMQILAGKTQSSCKWSNSTIMKALRLKFSCGSNGYNELLKQHIPLPSERTLRRKKENVDFQKGILNDVFDILQKQVSLFKDDREKDAAIAVDEMSIVSGEQFHPSTHSHIGYASIPDNKGNIHKATHALVIMLGGIFSRWKQIVAYYYTSNGFPSSRLKSIIEEVIAKAESIGLKIHSITSDMGSVNQAMWRTFGNISASRYLTITNSISHPLDNNRQLFFFADGPHLLKNLRSCLQINKTTMLPTTFVRTHNLSSNTVKCQHLAELLEIQENIELKLTAQLQSNDIVTGKYNKMKVNKAKRVLSTNVSSALNFLAEEKGKKEYNTTAAFIEIVSKWYTLSTSRSRKVALGKIPGNDKSENKYNDSIQFLYSVIELFRNLEVGGEKRFKPVQCGIMITTKSIIELVDVLITQRNYEYILTSRFTQDCVENLFSLIRAKHQIPNALQFKQDLKQLCISRYIKPTKTSNYEEDDRQFIGDFLSQPKNTKQTESFSDIPAEPETNIRLCNIQMNILYNIAGYIVSSIIKSNCTVSRI